MTLDLADLQQRLRAFAAARQWQFREGLPDWLKHAATSDQQAYGRILLRIQQAGSEGDSQDVPELLDYARERLLARLKADFPGVAIDPDKVEISVVQYSGPAGGEIAGGAAVSRLRRSLTYFALSHFFNVHSGVRSYRSLGEEPLPAGLDDHYVSELVRSLDLGESYQALLVAGGCKGSGERSICWRTQAAPPRRISLARCTAVIGKLTRPMGAS